MPHVLHMAGKGGCSMVMTQALLVPRGVACYAILRCPSVFFYLLQLLAYSVRAAASPYITCCYVRFWLLLWHARMPSIAW